jgi:hypothetical protein
VVGQAGAFNLTNGRAQIVVNASAVACSKAASNAYYNATLGASNIAVTTPTTRATTAVDARWRMFGWVNTSAGGPIHSSNKSRTGYVLITAYIAVLNSSTGALVGSNYVTIVTSDSQHAFKTHHFTGNLTALKVYVPMSKGVTYDVESWLAIQVLSLVKINTASGNFGWATVTMPTGSHLTDIQLS